MRETNVETVTREPVDGTWLDEVSPWLSVEHLPPLTVLPDRVVDGKAEFSADIAPLVKQIRSHGFEAQLLPTTDQTFRSEYGANGVTVISFLLNVGSNAAWDSFVLLLRMIKHRMKGSSKSGEEPQLTLVQGIIKHPDGGSALWQKFSGPYEQVMEVAESTVREYISVDPVREPPVVESVNEGSDSHPVSPE